jgi:hypothetical protein
MRRLVKLPGPSPQTIRSTPVTATPASAKASATAGMSRSPRGSRIATVREARISPPAATHTLPA